LKNIWLIDSSCLRHMTGDKGCFSSLVPVVTKRYIIFGDNGRGHVLSEGEIKVSVKITLRRVSLVQSLGHNLLSVSEGPIRRTREGGSEWEPIKILLEGDGNSNKMNTASNTRLRLTTQVGQAHVATGVPLDLGTNTQPSDPRTQRKTKPRVYRPTPVRPVSTTGQTGPCW
jgi:hypothetical protein